MDNLPEYSTQEETKQMQKMQLYQKLVIFTLLKFKWSILLIFAAMMVFGAIARYVQFSRSPHKYEGSVTLFYTPRASEEVKPLSMNHVLGVFSRQQIFRQFHVVHVGAAHQNRIRILDIRYTAVVFRQKRGALLGNVI